jgi:RNA polymerase sigma-70 factor (ECF subfamily)
MTIDHDLIKQLQQGDLQTLGELYDRYRHLVYRVALAITGDHEAASDLLQDVFLRLFRFADRIDPQRPLEPWLYRMTTNLSYSWVKRNRRWLFLEELSDWLVSPIKNTPAELAEKHDDWEKVHEAVSALPLSQRGVVVLYYLNDLSIDEISEILEVPEGTIKSRLHYGRLALRRRLGLAGLAEGEAFENLNYEGS